MFYIPSILPSFHVYVSIESTQRNIVLCGTQRYFSIFETASHEFLAWLPPKYSHYSVSTSKTMTCRKVKLSSHFPQLGQTKHFYANLSFKLFNTYYKRALNPCCFVIPSHLHKKIHRKLFENRLTFNTC